MFERFTHDAREVVVLAQCEARALGHGWLGTEHLLLGLVAQPAGLAGRVLARADMTLPVAREALVRTLGPGEDDAIDRDALATIGIDVDEVERRVEAAFGPGAMGRRGRCRRGRISPGWCFTARAKKALELALKEALGRGDRFVGAEHVLLGLLREGEGLAARLLADAGVTLEWARAAVDEETRLAG